MVDQQVGRFRKIGRSRRMPILELFDRTLEIGKRGQGPPRNIAGGAKKGKRRHGIAVGSVVIAPPRRPTGAGLPTRAAYPQAGGQSKEKDGMARG